MNSIQNTVLPVSKQQRMSLRAETLFLAKPQNCAYVETEIFTVLSPQLHLCWVSEQIALLGSILEVKPSLLFNFLNLRLALL